MPTSLVTVVLEQHGVVRYLGRQLQSPGGLERFARALGGHLLGMDQALLPAMLTIPATLSVVEDARRQLKELSDLLAAVVDPAAAIADRLASAAILLALVDKEFHRERVTLLPAAALGLDPALSSAVANELEQCFLAYYQGGSRDILREPPVSQQISDPPAAG
jgi:hypothetical protein